MIIKISKHTFHNILLLILTVVGTGMNLSAQQTWTLEKCVNQALMHNLEVKQSALNVEFNESFLKQSQAGRYPSLNASGSHYYNFGRSIDPTTNDFVNTAIRSNSFGLNSSVVLFGGLQQTHTIEKNKIALKASTYDLEQTKNQVALAVLSTYLQILLNEENIANIKQQSVLTNSQIERTKALVEAGALVEGDLYDLKAQRANEEVQLVDAENSLTISYLELRQLMGIDPFETIEVVMPDLKVDPENFENDSLTFKNLYEQVAQSYPTIKSAELNLISSQKDIAIAKSALQPTLALGGSIGTNYSSIGQEVVDVRFNGVTPIGFLENDQNTIVVTNDISPVFQQTSFGDQLQTNLRQSVGLSLSVPIFNGWQAKEALQRAKINYLVAAYSKQQTENQLQKELQQALTNLNAAQKKYIAALKSQKATAKAYYYSEERYKQKILTTVDFIDAKNRLSVSESSLLQTKYDYIFQSKVLDFYLGEPLRVNY